MYVCVCNGGHRAQGFSKRGSSYSKVISLSFPLLLGPLDERALPTPGKPSSEEQKQALQISFSGISAVSVHTLLMHGNGAGSGSTRSTVKK